MENLYRERIIDLYANKKNFGKLNGRTHEIKHKNPFCDDEIVIELKVEKGKIVDAKFSGRTCFVSAVSAEVLMEKIKGMKVEKLDSLSKKDIDEALGFEINATRAGCEVFPLDALKKLNIGMDD
jgi:nitrogen fixation NifU-like protein